MGFQSTDTSGRRWVASKVAEAIAPAANAVAGMRSFRSKKKAAESDGFLFDNSISESEEQTTFRDSKRTEATADTLRSNEGCLDNTSVVDSGRSPLPGRVPPLPMELVPKNTNSSQQITLDESTKSLNPARGIDFVEQMGLQNFYHDKGVDAETDRLVVNMSLPNILPGRGVSIVVPKQQPCHDHHNHGAGHLQESSVEECQSGEEQHRRRHSRRSSSIRRKHQTRGQPRSRSHSQSRSSLSRPHQHNDHPMIKVRSPPEHGIIDHQGRCPCHPFVQLRRRSTRTGDWRALLDSCPLCVATEDDGTTGDGVDDSSLKNATLQQQKPRQRSRSYSQPRHTRCDFSKMSRPGTRHHAGDFVEEASKDIRPRPSRSRSRTMRFSGLSSKLDGTKDAREGASSTDAKPMTWIYCHNNEMVGGEDESVASHDVTQVSESLAMTEEVQFENDSLHQSMDQAMQLASGMGERIANCVHVHEASVREYEEKLANMKDELSQKEEVSTTLMEQNQVLRAMVVMGEKEASDYKEHCKHKWIKLTAEKEKAYQENIKKMTLELEDAHQSCRVLQEEIKSLRQALQESSVHCALDSASF